MSQQSPLDKAFVQLGVSTRNGHDESMHYGAVVGLARDGSIEFALGDPKTIVYPRSSTKPIQATAMVASGLDLPPRLLALVCASHDGSPMHLAAAREILTTAGLTEDDLGNTKDYPLDDDAAADVLRCGGVKPAHAMSLTALARVFRTVVMSDPTSAPGKVAHAMRSHPEMVGGPTRDITLLMQGVPGLLGKDGAEGVFAIAMPDGRAVALKIADGANRARPPMMKAALEALGIDTSQVDPKAFDSTIYGHGKPVGSVRITAKL
jgi:L-asparaginase II